MYKVCYVVLYSSQSTNMHVMHMYIGMYVLHGFNQYFAFLCYFIHILLVCYIFICNDYILFVKVGSHNFSQLFLYY